VKVKSGGLAETRLRSTPWCSRKQKGATRTLRKLGRGKENQGLRGGGNTAILIKMRAHLRHPDCANGGIPGIGASPVNGRSHGCQAWKE